MPRTSRIVRAFVMHGRTSGSLLDYADFFDWLGGLARPDTRIEVGAELVLAIDRAVRTSNGWNFRFISGNPHELPLVYDESTGEAVTEEAAEGRWRATATRVAVTPMSRLMAIEGRRAGVGSSNLERYFSRIAMRRGYAPQLALEMNPLPSPSFEEELDAFGRIREASIVTRRPNKDWDDANDVLSDLADTSGAHRASLSVNAARGESLNTGRGIMGLIRRHVRRPLTNVENVSVTGTLAGSGAERTVSLARHQMQDRVALATNTTLIEEDDEVFDAQQSLLGRSQQLVSELMDVRPGEEV